MDVRGHTCSLYLRLHFSPFHTSQVCWVLTIHSLTSHGHTRSLIVSMQGRSSVRPTSSQHTAHDDGDGVSPPTNDPNNHGKFCAVGAGAVIPISNMAPSSIAGQGPHCPGSERSGPTQPSRKLAYSCLQHEANRLPP